MELETKPVFEATAVIFAITVEETIGGVARLVGFPKLVNEVDGCVAGLVVLLFCIEETAWVEALWVGELAREAVSALPSFKSFLGSLQHSLLPSPSQQ